MKQNISVLVGILLVTLPNWSKQDEVSVSEENRHPHEDLPFFTMIQKLNLDWDDISGLYRNVSAEVETEMCRSKCKTAIAFWVLQSLKPCDIIEKVDCPKGLLCCTYAEESDTDKHGPAQNQHGIPVVEKAPIISIEDDEHHWLDPEPFLDPIPDEEPPKFESTVMITS